MYRSQKREHKREVLKNAALKDSGNYYKILKAFYNFYAQKAKEQGKEYAVNVEWNELIDIISDCNVNSTADYHRALQYQTDLRKLGYIDIRKVNGEWRFYIINELDF